MLPLLLTVAQAAEYLGVGETTLRRWMKAGVIAYVIPGGAEQYLTRDDCADFVASLKRIRATPPVRRQRTSLPEDDDVDSKSDSNSRAATRAVGHRGGRRTLGLVPQ